MWALDLDDFSEQCGGESNPLLTTISKSLGVTQASIAAANAAAVANGANTINDNTLQVYILVLFISIYVIRKS